MPFLLDMNKKGKNRQTYNKRHKHGKLKIEKHIKKGMHRGRTNKKISV